MEIEKHFKSVSLSQFLEQIDSSGFFWIAKRLSGNDTGLTGGHQVGLYLPRYFFEINFPEICTTDKHNPESFINDLYFPRQDHFIKNIRAIYYNSKFFPELGLKKKYNEFRLTRWGGNESPAQDHENTGSICLLAVKRIGNATKALCWVASTVDEENTIETWLGADVDPGQFYSSRTMASSEKLQFLDQLPENWLTEFPSGQEIFSKVLELIPGDQWTSSIDELLLKRRELEFSIFREVEKHDVLPEIKEGFDSVEEFIKYSHSISNRRKSRTGKSLELNLESIFTDADLMFQTQAKTEQNKKPDFLFPSKKAYHDMSFQSSRLHMLAAKTCCKDRWRQILSEANRVKAKHLFTLQEGISENQLSEMNNENVQLVVPQPIIRSFPDNFRNKILNLEDFVSFIKQSQSGIE
jgi:type II restriction enzyme